MSSTRCYAYRHSAPRTPEVVIGDGGFGTIQARIPETNGEMVITRYRLAELLDKLDELTGEHCAREDDARS